MDHVVLELKAMVLRLLQINNERYYTFNLPEDTDVESAQYSIRNVVERMVGCGEIPLHWYEYDDNKFWELVTAKKEEQK